MFVKSQYQTLFAYLWHIRSKPLKCAEQLSLRDYQDNPGYGHGSIYSLFFHLLRTEQSWRLGLETGKQVPLLRLRISQLSRRFTQVSSKSNQIGKSYWNN
jgi:uncharacterized damage-inducible protein DinB